MSSHPYPAGYCRRASRHEHLLGVPTLLTSAADALEVVAAALHVPERVETIALLLDDDRRGRTVVVVDGTEPADSLIEVVECLCDAMSDEGGQLVVASVRPSLGLVPGDTDRWLEASAIADDRGCTLLDWFVVRDRIACRVGDLIAEPSRW